MRDTPLKSALGIMTIGKLNKFGPSAHDKISKHFETLGALADADEASLIACTNIAQRNLLMGSGITALGAAHLEATQELEIAAAMNVEAISIYDERYPDRLRGISNQPSILYAAGDLSLLDRSVAFVGSRSPTRFGEVVTERMVLAVAQDNWGVVTGLEYGTEAIATRAALKASVPVVAILASGVDQYPSGAERLLGEIGAAEGLVLSEQPVGKKADFGTQTRRYRLVTGLSAATFILPMEQESSPMHSLKYALSQGKPVFAPTIPDAYLQEPLNATILNLTRMTPVQYATLCGWKDEYMEAAERCERQTAVEAIRNKDDYPQILARLDMMLAAPSLVMEQAVGLSTTFP